MIDSNPSNPVAAGGNFDIGTMIKTAVHDAREAERARELRGRDSAPGEFILLECNCELKIQAHVLLHALDLPKEFWFKLHPQTDGPRDPHLHWLPTLDL